MRSSSSKYWAVLSERFLGLKGKPEAFLRNEDFCFVVTILGECRLQFMPMCSAAASLTVLSGNLSYTHDVECVYHQSSNRMLFSCCLPGGKHTECLCGLLFP